MKFKLHTPTSKLLEGLKGIEIGAASHNSFGVDALNLCDGENQEIYEKEQRKLGNEPARIDILADAHDTKLPDNSQDFVLSSHVIEHLVDPIKAFREWTRIVKDGGYIVAIIPLPNALPEDANRPLSTVEQLRTTNKTHDKHGDLHHWVFNLESFKQIITELNRGRYGLGWKLVAEEAVDSKVGNGFFVAYQVTKK